MASCIVHWAAGNLISLVFIFDVFHSKVQLSRLHREHSLHVSQKY